MRTFSRKQLVQVWLTVSVLDIGTSMKTQLSF